MKNIRKTKGEYGYIQYKKITVALRTVVMFAASLGIYALGYSIMHTNKNLWTVIAILGMLPASKSAVNLIMFLRFQSLSAEAYVNYSTVVSKLPVLYETVLTTTERAYYLPVLVCFEHTVCGLCKKDAKEIKKLETYIKETLERDNLQNVTVKLFAEEKQFFERLETMNMNFENKEDKSAALIFSTIKAVSL